MLNEFLTKAIYRQEIDFSLLELIFDEIETLSHDQKMQVLIVLSQSCMEGRNFNRLVHLFLSKASFYCEETVDAVDICGTGGSGIDRINCSSLVAFILSSLRIPVVKHGNRAGSGRFGSFDLLESLAVPILTDAEKLREVLAEVNLAFIYAPQVFPFLKEFADVRKSLQIATIFNVLGPLLNPFRPKFQYIGCSYEQFLPLIYQSAKQLGREDIVVYRGINGLDDIELEKGSILFDGKFSSINAADFKLAEIKLANILAKTNDEKIKIAKAIINGQCETDHMIHVLANAAFFYSRLKSIPLFESYQIIYDHVKSGKVAIHFKQVKEAYGDCIRQNYSTAIS
jgi:anthranilate phosphoribosyltransferase